MIGTSTHQILPSMVRAKPYKIPPKKKAPESKPKEKKQQFRTELPSEPTDDVYLTWCYKRPVYEAEVALDMLKKFQPLDFTPPDQEVYADITLDMATPKKTLEPFDSTLIFPYRFTESVHKVLAFTEKEEEATLASKYGAAIVGGAELIKPILNGEINADFYVAVPSVVSKLSPLRNFLKQKFPKTKNGSLSYDIIEMLEFFTLCHKYRVENVNMIRTPIAKLDMPNDQILANLDAVIKDVCKYKPLKYGPFVTCLSIRGATSESLDVKFERFLPEGAVREEVKEVKEEAKEEEDEEEDEKAKEEEDDDNDDQGEMKTSR
uniref:Mitochondrial ribosomal protein L1 n=1 Tax=Varanus komodoensis TaxID=61221 RepID=A0A8D2Q0P6_VARKO